MKKIVSPSSGTVLLVAVVFAMMLAVGCIGGDGPADDDGVPDDGGAVADDAPKDISVTNLRAEGGSDRYHYLYATVRTKNVGYCNILFEMWKEDLATKEMKWDMLSSDMGVCSMMGFTAVGDGSGDYEKTVKGLLLKMVVEEKCEQNACRIRVRVDPDNIFEEIDEDNNIVEETITF